LAGAGHFLDQPRLGFTDRNVYMNINQADDKGIHETVIVRVPRAGFENPQGPGGYGYALLEPASLRVAQNVSGPTEYFVGHKDTSTLRIASIEDNSNYLQFQDVSEPTIADHNWTMKTPGGQDVLGRQARSQQTGVTGVTQDGDGNLWAAWSEGREVEDKKGNTFIPAGQPTRPHIAVAILSVKPGQPPAITLKKRYVYWNASYALALPDLATDANGEVAMVFDWGGGTEYLNHAVAFLSGGLVDRTVAFGTTDQTTTGEPSDNNFGNPAGDYQTVRPIAPPHGGCLVAAGDVNQGEHVGYPVFTVFSRPGLACPTHFFPLPPPAGPALPPRLEGTALALSCPSEVNAGQTYTIGGTLSPTIAAAPIRITYTSSAPGTETVSHTVSTDSSGAFSDQAPGSPVGTETVDATYPGNQSFGAAEQKCSVAVHELIP
jgi:hypothetical protein